MKPPTMPQYPDLAHGPEAAMRHVVKRVQPKPADAGAALKCAKTANEVKPDGR